MSQLPQVGYIYTQGTLAYALFYSRENTLPDGSKQIVLASNRPHLLRRRRSRPGAQQKYDLGVIEMRFPKNGGDGEGKIILQGMAKIDDKTGKIEIENYRGQPTRLMQIKEVRGPRGSRLAGFPRTEGGPDRSVVAPLRPIPPP